MDIKSLSYDYDQKKVLNEITMSVGKGEIFGILGPNGCGKTTLLKNLNRDLSPLAGCVMVDDTDISKISKKDIAKKVAVVPQTNEIRFAFTVRDIVTMGRIPFQNSAFRGETSEDLKIIDDAMIQTGIIDMADRHINTMSGGERQRAIIARAIAQTPQILLMDEPTLHLDIHMQFEILDLIEKLSRASNMTIVMVSHDLPLVARYCDRMVLIHDKRIHSVGTAEEILTPENMRLVFKVDAELEKDARNGKNTVKLHGSCN